MLSQNYFSLLLGFIHLSIIDDVANLTNVGLCRCNYLHKVQKFNLGVFKLSYSTSLNAKIA